jgi:biopolymer transport protein ExbD
LKFGRRTRVNDEIPTASMADIAFLLLIFFMVSTVFAIEEGLLLQLPSKEGVVKKIARKNILTISAYPGGAITINDEPVVLNQIRARVEQEIMDNPNLVVVVETDREARYGVMVDVLDELKLAQATRISLKPLQKN